MASVFGDALRLSIFGQSHSEAIGFSLDGLPAGIPVDLDELQAFMDRRAPGRDPVSTARRETDRPRFIAGLHEGRTCGAPLAAIIENADTRSQDYSGLERVPRPGHADWPAHVKYRGYNDVAGGGHFSGRLTAPLCAAGGVAIQALATQGITVVAHLARVADVEDEPLDPLAFRPEQAGAVRRNPLPCISVEAAEDMRARIMEAREARDSVGGIVECAAYGIPAGVGDPMFDGMENRIAKIAFGIPAVKGVEFGAGFGVAGMRGSEDNDPYRMDSEGRVHVTSNNAGGILGGITTGAPLVWRAAIKPTPSIGRAQESVDLVAGEDAELTVRGRHDPCIAPRAVPVAEAACALAVLDALLVDGAFRAPGDADGRFTRA